MQYCAVKHWLRIKTKRQYHQQIENIANEKIYLNIALLCLLLVIFYFAILCDMYCWYICLVSGWFWAGVFTSSRVILESYSYSQRNCLSHLMWQSLQCNSCIVLDWLAKAGKPGELCKLLLLLPFKELFKALLSFRWIYTFDWTMLLHSAHWRSRCKRLSKSAWNPRSCFENTLSPPAAEIEPNFREIFGNPLQNPFYATALAFISAVGDKRRESLERWGEVHLRWRLLSASTGALCSCTTSVIHLFFAFSLSRLM